MNQRCLGTNTYAFFGAQQTDGKRSDLIATLRHRRS
jgi:hypothetical protein